MEKKNQNQNQNQNMKPNSNSKENTEKLHKKIKETWSGLSDNDVKLYDSKREDFFAKLKEKNNISKEDAQKKLQQLEKDCGCASTAKAA
jgi:uncharacterized protein YjbJ (UPF0337 family)